MRPSAQGERWFSLGQFYLAGGRVRLASMTWLLITWLFTKLEQKAVRQKAGGCGKKGGGDLKADLKSRRRERKL